MSSPLNLRKAVTYAAYLFLGTENTLVKMWICTDSSDPSLVTYAPYFVYVGRQDSGETVDMYRLI